MKKFLVILFTFNSVLWAGQFSPRIDKSLGTSAAVYHFEEGSGTGTDDYSGNGNRATFNGSVTWIKGKFNNAVSIGSALGDAVFTNSFPITGNQSRTLNVWIREDDPAYFRYIYSQGNTAAGRNWWTIYQNTDGHLHFSDATTDWDATNTIFGVGISTNVWTMVTYTHGDGTSTQDKFYINGFLTDYQAGSVLNTSTDNTTKIGSRSTSSPAGAKCEFDDFVISSRAWTSGEIRDIYLQSQGRQMADEEN